MQVPTGPLCTSSKLGADISENYLLAKLDVLLPLSQCSPQPKGLFFIFKIFLANHSFTELDEQSKKHLQKNSGNYLNS